MEAGFEAKVCRNELELFVAVNGQPANKLHPETTTFFSVKEFPATAKFIPSDNKMNIILSRDDESFKGTKLK